MSVNIRKYNFFGVLLVILMLGTSLTPTYAREKTKNSLIPTKGRIKYVEYLPDNYDPDKSYPVILALGGGSQSIEYARHIFRTFLKSEAEKRGYIVIAPAARDKELFFTKSADIFPGFLNIILNKYNVLDGKLDLMGYSNGGISAFYLATEYPQYFKSISTWPGYLPDFFEGKIANLAGMCIISYWGSNDEGWGIEVLDDAEKLDALGIPHRIISIENDTHQMIGLQNAESSIIFDRIENCQDDPQNNSQAEPAS